VSPPGWAKALLRTPVARLPKRSRSHFPATTYASLWRRAQKVLDATRGGDYPVFGVRCEAHRGDAREPRRTSPDGTAGDRKEAGGNGKARSGNEPSGAPVRVKHDGRVGKRSVAAVPAAPAKLEPAPTGCTSGTNGAGRRARGPGQAPGTAASPGAQANGPPRAFRPDSLYAPPVPVRTGGASAYHPPALPRIPLRPGPPCASRSRKRPARPGSGLHTRRLSCRGSPSAQTAAGLTGASARACATTRVCHG
jgi:hypothetical protein